MRRGKSARRAEFRCTRPGRARRDSALVTVGVCSLKVGNCWQLAPELIEVMSHHHVPERSVEHAGFVALLQLADLLCRMGGLNYGYVEQRQMDLAAESGFALLAEQSTTLREFDWAGLTFELDSCMEEVDSLVRDYSAE